MSCLGNTLALLCQQFLRTAMSTVSLMAKIILIAFILSNVSITIDMGHAVGNRLFNLLQQLSMLQKVMNGCMRCLNNLSFSQMFLKGLNIVHVFTMVLAHVLFQSGRVFLVERSLLPLLGGGQRLQEPSILLQDVKAKFEDVVHLERVTEALLLVVRVDVAKSLTTSRMFNSH